MRRRDAPRAAKWPTAWFDSGSMPVAQWHYPFENRELFTEQFPADYICEAIDQTRGWFYTLHAVSTLLFDQPSFKNVICLGHIMAEDGSKMSKSRGNIVNPWARARCARRRRHALVHVHGQPARQHAPFLRQPGERSRRQVPADAVEQLQLLRDLRQPERLRPRRARVPLAERSVLDRWVLARSTAWWET